MLARVASSDSLAKSFQSIPISSDLYEEIEFPAESSTCAMSYTSTSTSPDDFQDCLSLPRQIILLSMRDHPMEFYHRHELVAYLECQVEYDEHYVYFQYEPENAPQGTRCELVFRTMKQLVDFVEKFASRTYWTTEQVDEDM